MDRLWAPWRKQYVSSEKEKGCIFCNKPKEDNDNKNYIVARRENCYAILNIYPYNNGHLMIIPYRHIGNISKLNAPEMLEMMQLTGHMELKLKKVLNPEGFNLGINMGKSAGAGYAEHLHIHLVPRWSGDTNFMPIFGDTKVIPQALDALYEQLIKD